MLKPKAKPAAVALLALFVLSVPAPACTIFKSRLPGTYAVAHNMDWVTPMDGVLAQNPRNVKKTGLLLGTTIPPAEWVSKFASVSFANSGVEFPSSGMNEKGLVIGILELASAKLPPESDPRPALSAGQFVQYNLDRSETIEEVIASNQVLRPYSTILMPHYFTCDASGRCAVMEYVNGELKVYRDASLPFAVMTNSPYTESTEAARSCLAGECSEANNSLWRFGQTAVLQQELSAEQPLSPQLFAILDAVQQHGRNSTRHQVVYDFKNLKIEVHRPDGADSAGPSAYYVPDFSRFDCRQPRVIADVGYTTRGDLSQAFAPLTREKQYRMARVMGFPEALARAYQEYPFHSVACLEK